MFSPIRKASAFASQVRASAKVLKALRKMPDDKGVSRMTKSHAIEAVTFGLIETSKALNISTKNTLALMTQKPVTGMSVGQLSSVSDTLRVAKWATPFLSRSMRQKVQNMNEALVTAKINVVTSLHVQRQSLLQDGEKFDRWAQRGAEIGSSVMNTTALRLRNRNIDEAKKLGDDIDTLNKKLSIAIG